ncbi:MAG: FAD:protein FMN transferase [Pseudomonadota bacterium]
MRNPVIDDSHSQVFRQNTGWFAVRLAMLVLLLAPLDRAVADQQWATRDAALMGTRISVTVAGVPAETANAAIDAVLAEISRIEQLMSTYIDESAISAINRDAHRGPVAAGAELYGLIEQSLAFSRMSDGAFDITYDSVGQHYDFRAGKRPDDATTERERVRIGYNQLSLNPDDYSIAFSHEGVRINLGGIAKGYAVEQAVGVLARFGVRHAMISAGGDTRLVGDRLGQPWIVGIQNPRADDSVAVRLGLADEAISTSGDYERYFEADGVRYHHIVSPQSGRPAEGVRSASVIGPNGVWTDALSTTVFVLGVEAGLALIDSLADYEAVIVDERQRLHYSHGLAAGDVAE